jgi:dolichyl-phosphate-mannose--protein O-mannosyl transferase
LVRIKSTRDTIFVTRNIVSLRTKLGRQRAGIVGAGYNYWMWDLDRNSSDAIQASQVKSPQSSGLHPLPLDLTSANTSSEETSAISRIYRHPATTAMIFGLAALALLLAGLGNPATMFYDEGYFVPEARVFSQGTPNPSPFPPPLAKPPLGKLIMAIGMKAAGDNSFGWRIAGAVCGALALVAVYFWAYLLLQDSRLASLAAALTLLNNFLFVMSRIATVDAFLMFFLMWSLVAYTAALTLDVRVATRRLLFTLSGVSVGLAGACKWNAIDTLAAFFLVTFALLWVARRRAADSNPSLSGYARRIEQIGIPVLLIGLIVAPIASYSLTYWPLCRILHRPFNFHELVAMHIFIWHFNSTTISNISITSPWYSWPLNVSPQRALSYLVGNPVVTWGGLAALALCVRRFWKAITLPEGLVFLLFASNYLQWVVTPEKGLFYYYYYPCVMILGVAIAVAMRSLPARVFGLRISLLLLLAAAIFFLWCYPRMAHLEAPWDCALGCWS